ncbi:MULTISPECIES: PQ-loop domain-containing transporter [unclassified Mycoplasma]|uniref:PQ-loop domain-containing transporter n=1 Tax=unclassified Mycoplasma TaxID=2683645 RepID=UPI00216B560D|nr:MULTISPECIES: PQ-loop domain-containing transporter [unclassified Mycoplasma]MCS4536617.1 PQ-loop domain-containing transporter [Mycoplasma sp. CSL7475-4]MCT4469563.1 PQ-loop domain-containing transporter [Mycoplasma sp. HS2188]
MDLLKLFILDSSHPVSAWFAFIFGVLSVILTISVGIPQFVHLIKTKKTEDGTKFYSFWMFFTGVVGWMLIGAWDPSQVKMTATMFANLVSSFILSGTIFLSYKYSSKIKKQKFSIPALIISLSISTLAASLSIWGYVANKHMPVKLMSVVILIFPMLTSFSFLPGAIKSLEEKKFSGMSKGMLFTLLFINIMWLGYWIFLGINRGDFDSNILTSIVWQSISLSIYSSQVYLMIITRK